jgi:hypothetical protein
MKLAILNTSILTTYGQYDYSQISLEEARQLIAAKGENIISAVGHQSTAEILTELLGVAVPMNRIQFAQEAGQQALVFKLKSRVPEGVILSRANIEQIGYEFGILTREKGGE